MFEKIKMTLALEMSDRFQYGDILRQYFIPVLPRENQKGRGCAGWTEEFWNFRQLLLWKREICI